MLEKIIILIGFPMIIVVISITIIGSKRYMKKLKKREKQLEQEIKFWKSNLTDIEEIYND